MNNQPFLSDRVDALVQETDTRIDSLFALDSLRRLEFHVFIQRGFWARLRWLVWGS